MRVIEHPWPFILLGADVLCGGKPGGSWNFACLKVTTLGPGECTGDLVFEMNGREVQEAIPHAPAGVGDPQSGLHYMAADPPL